MALLAIGGFFGKRVSMQLGWNGVGRTATFDACVVKDKVVSFVLSRQTKHANNADKRHFWGRWGLNREGQNDGTRLVFMQWWRSKRRRVDMAFRIWKMGWSKTYSLLMKQMHQQVWSLCGAWDCCLWCSWFTCWVQCQKNEWGCEWYACLHGRMKHGMSQENQSQLENLTEDCGRIQWVMWLAPRQFWGKYRAVAKTMRRCSRLGLFPVRFTCTRDMRQVITGGHIPLETRVQWSSINLGWWL